jgi:DNA-binding MarR family transcriptional regulator
MLYIRDMWLAMKNVIRTARKTINKNLEPLNLSGAGSNGLRQEQLAEQLDIGKAAASRVIDSLEAKGYVMRMREDEDKRAYRILLTDTAYTAEESIKAVYDNLYALVRKGIADEDVLHVGHLLSRIVDNLNGGTENVD